MCLYVYWTSIEDLALSFLRLRGGIDGREVVMGQPPMCCDKNSEATIRGAALGVVSFPNWSTIQM